MRRPPVRAIIGPMGFLDRFFRGPRIVHQLGGDVPRDAGDGVPGRDHAGGPRAGS